jgi:hypothetical protein
MEKSRKDGEEWRSSEPRERRKERRRVLAKEEKEGEDDRLR